MVSKKRLFLSLSLLVSSCLQITSVASAADSCSDILKWGLFDTRDSFSYQSQYDLVSRFVCGKSEESNEASLDLLAQLDIPIEGLPLPVESSASGTTREKVRKEFCNSDFESRVHRASFRNSVKKASYAISSAWTTCMSSRLLAKPKTSLTIINEKTFQLELYYDPPSFKNLLKYDNIKFDGPKAVTCSSEPRKGEITVRSVSWQCSMAAPTVASTSYIISFQPDSPMTSIAGVIPATKNPPEVSDDCVASDLRSCKEFRHPLGDVILNGHGERAYVRFSKVFVPGATVDVYARGNVSIPGGNNFYLEADLRWEGNGTEQSPKHSSFGHMEGPRNGGSIEYSGTLSQLTADKDGVVTVGLWAKCGDIVIVPISGREANCKFGSGSVLEFRRTAIPSTD